jgi:hypothetical protein
MMVDFDLLLMGDKTITFSFGTRLLTRGTLDVWDQHGRFFLDLRYHRDGDWHHRHRGRHHVRV